jgi:hypothetical protein
MPDGQVPPIGVPRDAAAGGQDAIHDLVARLDRDAARLVDKDPDLSRTIRKLAEVIERPGRSEDPAYRTRVAYALQDMEKLAGPIGSVPSALREEMSRLAITAPGLRNERLQEMMRATPAMDDPKLIREVRGLAASVARETGDQNSQAMRDRIDALENKIRLSPSGPGVVPAGQSSKATDAPPGGTPERPSAEPAAERVQARRSPGMQAGPEGQLPRWNDRVAPPPASPAPPEQAQAQVAVRGPGVIAQALGVLARSARQESPGWERQPTSIVDRSERHEQAFQQRRDDAAIRGAEQSQRAALDALQAYANGPGASILTKIQDAAKTEPGGVQGVLAEMREGGRFAGLRAQLNSDLVAERGAAAAYDRIAASLQQYGADRAAIGAVGTRPNAAAALDARFEKLDADIGRAAAVIPSRSDGKSLLDDVGDKLREVLDRAVSAVKSVFTPAADKSARASPGPSPSP